MHKITSETISSRLSYESRTNTLFVSFRSLHIKTFDDINIIKESMIYAIKNAKSSNDKVHVIVDYNDSYSSKDIFEQYWDMVDQIQATYYLSVSRFHVTSFGCNDRSSRVECGLRRATSERPFKVSKSLDA